MMHEGIVIVSRLARHTQIIHFLHARFRDSVPASDARRFYALDGNMEEIKKYFAKREHTTNINITKE